MNAGAPGGGDGLPQRWSRLLARLNAAPPAGRITAVAQPVVAAGSPRDRADRLVRSHGWSALGSRWIEIDEETARQTGVRVLATHLADERPLMARPMAEQLVWDFVELASPATYLTNGSWCAPAAPLSADARVGPFWTPISPGNFDGGIVAMGATLIAALWVRDDD